MACARDRTGGTEARSDNVAGVTGNDLWGWTDPQTGREYALMGLSNGTAFVDVTEPQSPLFLGRLPTHTTAALWRDIKVYRDHAYIVAGGAGEHGMQVFDLTRLRGVSGPQTWAADVHYGDFGHSHNLAIDEQSGFAYSASTNTCEGGLHIINLATPNNPLFAGCHNVTRTHDTRCVVYEGPDTAYQGRQICVSSNEDRVEVVDVTEKGAPLSLSSVTYPEMRYVHQGWLTEDHRYFLLGDLASRDMSEIAYFDTYPESDGPGTEGAWSVYPYLPSGTILVSDIDNGLFVLSMP